MQAEALEVVNRGAPGKKTKEKRMAYMRYLGQGHEVAISLPARRWNQDDIEFIRHEFEMAYKSTYGRIIPNLDLELVSWAIEVSVENTTSSLLKATNPTSLPKPYIIREIVDPGTGKIFEAPAYRRESLIPGNKICGPAIIVEEDTSTVVSPSFDATINSLGYIILEHNGEG